MKTKPQSSLKSSTKPIPKVTCGFVSAHSPIDSEIVNENWVAADSEIITETASTGDKWIHQRTKPLLTRKHSQPLLTKKRSTKTKSVSTRKSSMKQLPKMTRGFVSALSSCWPRKSQWKWATADSEIINETDSKGDAWIRQRLWCNHSIR